MVLKVKVRIEGLRETLRAFDEMSKGANNRLRDGSMEIAGKLMRAQQVAGAALGRQARFVSSRGLRVERDRAPVVSVGRRGGAKVKALLFGSEFGMTRHTGWYNHRRYNNLPNPQFFPHRGRGHSYWFFATAEAMQPEIESGWRDIADKIADDWGRGG